MCLYQDYKPCKKQEYTYETAWLPGCKPAKPDVNKSNSEVNDYEKRCCDERKNAWTDNW